MAIEFIAGGKIKRSRGRPEYVPSDSDRTFVSQALRAGSSQATIRACLGIADGTFRKHFRYEIMMARETLKTSAIGVLEQALADGSLDAAKFVLARQAGWTERQAIDLSNSDGSMAPKSLAEFYGIVAIAAPQTDGDAPEMIEHDPDPQPGAA